MSFVKDWFSTSKILQLSFLFSPYYYISNPFCASIKAQPWYGLLSVTGALGKKKKKSPMQISSRLGLISNILGFTSDIHLQKKNSRFSFRSWCWVLYSSFLLCFPVPLISSRLLKFILPFSLLLLSICHIFLTTPHTCCSFYISPFQPLASSPLLSNLLPIFTLSLTYLPSTLQLTHLPAPLPTHLTTLYNLLCYWSNIICHISSSPWLISNSLSSLHLHAHQFSFPNLKTISLPLFTSSSFSLPLFTSCLSFLFPPFIHLLSPLPFIHHLLSLLPSPSHYLPPPVSPTFSSPHLQSKQDCLLLATIIHHKRTIYWWRLCVLTSEGTGAHTPDWWWCSCGPCCFCNPGTFTLRSFQSLHFNSFHLSNFFLHSIVSIPIFLSHTTSINSPSNIWSSFQ